MNFIPQRFFRAKFNQNWDKPMVFPWTENQTAISYCSALSDEPQTVGHKFKKHKTDIKEKLNIHCFAYKSFL